MAGPDDVPAPWEGCLDAENMSRLARYLADSLRWKQTYWNRCRKVDP